jgi:Acyl-coenzyme A synthetases/AMP-(fatty) acid ligases
MDLQIRDLYGAPVGGEDAGELVIVGEFPSMPLYFRGDDGTRYRDAYYDFYADKGHQVGRHGDTVRRTHKGQKVIIGRSDGTLNQKGGRIGSMVIYNQREPFKERITGATAGDFTRPDTKQSITNLFWAMPDYTQGGPEDLVKAIKSAIRNKVGPYSVPSEIIAAPEVLRTKKGKLAEVVTKKNWAGTHIPKADLYGAELVCFYEGIAKDLAAKYSAQIKKTWEFIHKIRHKGLG